MVSGRVLSTDEHLRRVKVYLSVFFTRAVPTECHPCLETLSRGGLRRSSRTGNHSSYSSRTVPTEGSCVPGARLSTRLTLFFKSFRKERGSDPVSFVPTLVVSVDERMSDCGVDDPKLKCKNERGRGQ